MNKPITQVLGFALRSFAIEIRAMVTIVNALDSGDNSKLIGNLAGAASLARRIEFVWLMTA